MALARVVAFDGVSSERMEEMQREMQRSRPARRCARQGDPRSPRSGSEKSVVVVFFDTEDDYTRGDAALSAMPAGDTPGKRTSVAKYDVAFRMTD